MPKLIDEYPQDETIDQYVALARRIAERCAAVDPTIDTRPDPVVVATLMAGDKNVEHAEGLWNQLESIWQLILNWVNSH